jgi:bifunctional UDP-N-acetylglucosamine pyrophosphorylase / glucosamine-1-phosphate N-acetyltransferase
MTLTIVILAAGQGKRMRSNLPKVLHRLAGKTILEHVIDTAAQLAPQRPPIVVYGHQGDAVRHALANVNANWVEQTEQLGTGHALQQALPQLTPDGRVLVLYGDVPLISQNTLSNFITRTPANAVGIITAELTNPHGLGRIIRDEKNNIIDIIEEKDATKEERAIQEINSGIYLIPARYLQQWLSKLHNKNAQQEYYLTDIIKMAVHENIPIHSEHPDHYEEILGVNDRLQLAALERFYQRQQAEKLMRQGVTLRDPARFDLRGELTIGQDVVVDINVIVEGRVTIGNHCTIGPNCILRNVVLGDHVEIKANSFIDGAEIATHCTIGPFARIRPGTILASHVEVGNFAEIKNSLVGQASKIHHVSYIGDSEIGKQVNIGAGTITCNYDGVNKHRTVIGDNAFIGSNTEIVAPVRIGEGAMIGAGSTITEDAPAHQLTLARAKQCTVEGWKRKNKEKI